jgi:hypothetical protein
MFTSPSAFVDSNLAPFYGITAPQGSGLSPVSLDPTRHAGFLTMPGFIATKNPGLNRAPVKIGHFVRTTLFCQIMPPPPPGVPPPPADPNLDEHSRFAQHESTAFCASCHKMMDPIGFGWSQYDVEGRFCPLDHGVTNDGSGQLTATDVDGTFIGAVQLGQHIAASHEVQQCFESRVAQYAFGRTLSTDSGSADAPVPGQLDASGFAAGDMKALFVALTATNAFRFRDTTAVPQ